MRDLMAELKELRLHGMATAWAELTAQGESNTASSKWLLEHLLEQEHTDRAMRSVSHQMNMAKLPMHRDLASFDFGPSCVDRRLIGELARSLTTILDPQQLIAPEEIVRQKVREIVQEVKRVAPRGHIFNVGHGINQPCGQSGAVAPFPRVAGAASALARDRALRVRMAHAGRAAVDGRGADRLARRVIDLIDGGEVGIRGQAE